MSVGCSNDAIRDFTRGVCATQRAAPVHALRIVSLIVFILVALSARGADDFVFAGGFDPACTWPGACGGGAYCAANGCGAGECKPLAASSDSAKAPVCGCDGVSFWNSNTAASLGMAVASTAACSPQTTCGGFIGTACPANRVCAYVFDNALGCNTSDADGVCWGMPTNCAEPAGIFRSCSSSTCTNECAATKSGTFYFSDATCAM